MLGAVRAAGRDVDAALVYADAGRLPFRDSWFDAIFAGAILHHLRGPDHGLAELARVSRPGAGLAIFHPVGRAVLAARRGGTVAATDLLAAPTIEAELSRWGWQVDAVDDGADRYLAIAHRRRR